MPIWNPWHGCRKISPGCAHCYVYRRDESVGKDASVVTKTADYDLPLKKNRAGEYKLRPQDGTVYACMTSDFFSGGRRRMAAGLLGHDPGADGPAVPYHHQADRPV